MIGSSDEWLAPGDEPLAVVRLLSEVYRFLGRTTEAAGFEVSVGRHALGEDAEVFTGASAIAAERVAHHLERLGAHPGRQTRGRVLSLRPFR